MTADQISLFDEYTNLSERAAYKEREAEVLQAQYQAKVRDAQQLRERAKVIATQLGLVC